MKKKWSDEEKQWIDAGLCVAWMNHGSCSRGRRCGFKHLTIDNLATLVECDLFEACVKRRVQQKRLSLQAICMAETMAETEMETCAEDTMDLTGWNSLPVFLTSDIISIAFESRDKRSFDALMQSSSTIRTQASSLLKTVVISSPSDCFRLLPSLAKPTHLVIRRSSQAAERSKVKGRMIMQVLPKQLREPLRDEGTVSYLSTIERVTVEVHDNQSDTDVIIDIDSFLDPLGQACPKINDLVLSMANDQGVFGGAITLRDSFCFCGWSDDVAIKIKSLTIEHSEIFVSDGGGGLYDFRDYLKTFKCLSTLYLPSYLIYMDDFKQLAELKQLRKLCVRSFHFEDHEVMPGHLFKGYAPWTQLQLVDPREISQLSLIPISPDIHLILTAVHPSDLFSWKMTRPDGEGIDIFIGKQEMNKITALLASAKVFFGTKARSYYINPSVSSLPEIKGPKIPSLYLQTSSDMTIEDVVDMLAGLGPLGPACGLTELSILCVPLLPSFFDALLTSLPFIKKLTIFANSNVEVTIEYPFLPLLKHPSLTDLVLTSLNLHHIDQFSRFVLANGLEVLSLQAPRMKVHVASSHGWSMGEELDLGEEDINSEEE